MTNTLIAEEKKQVNSENSKKPIDKSVKKESPKKKSEKSPQKAVIKSGSSIDTIVKSIDKTKPKITWSISAGKIIHPVRLSITGVTSGPGLFEILEVLGRETVIRRLRRAAEIIPTQKV